MPVASTLKNSVRPARDGISRWPYLYEVLNCAAPGGFPRRHALATVDVVLAGRGEQRSHLRDEAGAERRLTLSFLDRWMSGAHARLQRVGTGWIAEDLGSTNGLRVNGKLVGTAELEDGDVLELGRTFLLFRAAQEASEQDLEAGPQTLTLVPGLELRFTQLAKVVTSPVPPPVMVLGEPGVGKERAARLVHALSGRKGAFVPVNCGAFPPDLVASMLFGHQKGAFTGATEDRAGLVRSAHQGTLFLDEVGELPLPAQPYLLRVLQEREVIPVGGTRAIPVDLQLVTATNRDLQQLEQAERFRSDLLGRLSGFSLLLPPLRERLEDLGLVLRALLASLELPALTFTPEAARTLFEAQWAGNIRELERTVQVSGALAQGRVVQREHLLESRLTTPAAPTPAAAAAPLSAEDEATRAKLVAALEANRGNISGTARDLGKARTQVQRWLSRFAIDPERFR